MRKGKGEGWEGGGVIEEGAKIEKSRSGPFVRALILSMVRI